MQTAGGEEPENLSCLLLLYLDILLASVVLKIVYKLCVVQQTIHRKTSAIRRSRSMGHFYPYLYVQRIYIAIYNSVVNVITYIP